MVMVTAARSVMVPAPLAAVATWMKFENEAPVVPPPWFVMVAEKVVAVPAVAVVGVIVPAVRSGAAQVTVRTVLVLHPADDDQAWPQY